MDVLYTLTCYMDDYPSQKMVCEHKVYSPTQINVNITYTVSQNGANTSFFRNERISLNVQRVQSIKQCIETQVACTRLGETANMPRFVADKDNIAVVAGSKVIRQLAVERAVYHGLILLEEEIRRLPAACANAHHNVCYPFFALVPDFGSCL